MKTYIVNLVAALIICTGSLYLTNTSQASASMVALSECNATLGAKCHCDEGQTCEAGLFKCKCVGGDTELEEA
jgi:hypothetical protein